MGIEHSKPRSAQNEDNEKVEYADMDEEEEEEEKNMEEEKDEDVAAEEANHLSRGRALEAALCPEAAKHAFLGMLSHLSVIITTQLVRYDASCDNCKTSLI